MTYAATELDESTGGTDEREARVASEPEALLHVRCAGIDIAG
jgi:hypothetical protein